MTQANRSNTTHQKHNHQGHANSGITSITQLTEQVSILQLAHNEINSKLDKLAEFIMAQSGTNKTPSPSKCKAAGGLRGSPGDES